MKIFIDFDDVLFHTKKSAKDLIEIFKKNGVSEEIFRKYYYEGNKYKYDIKKHMQKIASVYKNKDLYTALHKDVKKYTSDTKKYIFKEATAFVKQFPKKDLYLISQGSERPFLHNKSFQKLKIQNSGIENYFKKIIITEKSKASAIKGVIKKEKINALEKIYFLDDRSRHHEDVKRCFPHITTILMKEKRGRYNDVKDAFCDFEVKSLSKCNCIK